MAHGPLGPAAWRLLLTAAKKRGVLAVSAVTAGSAA